MSNLSIPITEDIKDSIKALFIDIGRKTLQEVKQQEVKARDYMNYKEVCAYMDITYQTLMSWINTKGLKHITIEGKRYIALTTLKEWLHNQEH